MEGGVGWLLRKIGSPCETGLIVNAISQATVSGQRLEGEPFKRNPSSPYIMATGFPDAMPSFLVEHPKAGTGGNPIATNSG